jgi:membrane fusion protein (multidrug efflux system)
VKRAHERRRIGLLLTVLVLAGCTDHTATATAPAADAPVVVVAVAPVATAVVERTAPLIGALFANDDVTVEAEVEGRIVWLGADMGDPVAQDAVLVRVDDEGIRASVREVEAQLVKARADSARAQVLRRQGIVANEEAETLRTQVAVLEARRDVLRVRLDRTVIRSPLDGAIAQRSVAVGEVVSIGDPLFEVVQTDPLKLRTPIPERFASILRIGEEVRLSVDAYPDRVFTGEVTRINPTSTAANRSIVIEARLPNADGVLKPGFFARGVLVYDTHGEALVVPASALATFAGVTKVFVVRDGRAEERVVRTGNALPDGRRIIEDGVALGDPVAVSDVDRLAHGMAVTVAGTP